MTDNTPKPVITTDMPKPDGIRDTIESIVVAFILAFVFRAFVVEAFVIPTGSMAPGLYGKHAQHRCTVCNYSFSYGIRESVRFANSNYFQKGTLENEGGYSVRCPNCGWNGDGNNDLNRSSETRVFGDSGDRILVLKWPYDVGGSLLGPKRWDVVVFKDPQDGDTNFIKRLIGLPGEVLELIDGDVYSAPVKNIPEDIRTALSKPPPPGNPDFRRLTSEQELRLAKHLAIQRKTKIAQDSLWIVHYDHDFRPDLALMQNNPGFNPPYWRSTAEGASDWDASTPVVRYTPKTDKEQWIELAGRPVQDVYAYNDVGMIPSNPVNVGDVRLKFVLFPQYDKLPATPAEAALLLALRKGTDEFELRIQLDGTIIMEKPGDRGIKRELARGKTTAFASGKPLDIEYENLDYRVALRINGEEVLATRDADYSPNLPKLLERPYRDGRYSQAAVLIGAKNLPLELRHLTVHRDVFYRSDCELESVSPTGRANPFARYPGWGTATNPILLRDNPTDYFCCGDNSPQSKDSRMWSDVCPLLINRGDYQYGTVPGDQMIGQAFFVYWPGGYRFSKDTPAVIPNVGRMRIIR